MQASALSAVETEIDGQFKQLYPIIAGHIYFQTLSAAIQLDLFGLLSRSGPLTRNEIAERLKIEEKPARVLLLGCTTLELVRKQGSRYVNTQLSERFLLKDCPGNLVAIIEWQHHINYKAMFHFYDALRANDNVGLKEFEGDEPTLYERLVHQPALEKIFQEAMRSISLQANRILTEMVDFSHVRYLVDVGGGDGTNLIALAKKNPHLRGAVFDSVSVCKIAQKAIEAAGLGHRLGTVPGDCFKSEFPKEADCLLFAHFFTIWSEKEDRALLRKCFNALPKDGTVVLFNMMQHDDEAGPLSAAMGK